MEKEFIEKLRAAWSVETCYPRARRFWKPELPELGHCTITALLVHEVYGGKIVQNDENFHFWNILPDGTEVDLTIKQFDEVPAGEFMKIDKEVQADELMGDIDVVMRFEILKDKMQLN